MPLSPFIFEYLYNDGNAITKRSVMIAISTYAFALAFGTKFRVISIVLICVGFIAGGSYGSINKNDPATQHCMPVYVIESLIILAVVEWLWRHFFEDETCWFYTIFENKDKHKNQIK